MLGFTLDTFDSTTQGVRLSAPVGVPTSRRVVEDVVVVGREGSLTRYAGWEDVPITFELLIRGRVEQSYALLAKACLNPKRLSLSGQVGRFRMVKHAQVSPLVREGTWGRCTLDLTCQPFAYHEDNPTHTLTPQAGTVRLVNPGLVQARPTITVYGTGTASFTINNTVYTVRDLAGSARLDSGAFLVSAGTRSQNPTLAPDFPVLTPGANTISLGVGAQKVEIVGNWRDP